MNTFHLVVVDTTGIQRYIFGSNRLRENVGASHLVYQATEGWLLDVPNTFLPADKHNIVKGKRLDDRPVTPESEWDAELLYAGGGNVVLLFRHQKDARHFARQFSLRLVSEAPGLDAVLVRHEFVWETTLLVKAVHDALTEMEAKKSAAVGQQPLLGLGVTAACQSTGLAAHHNFFEEDPDTHTKVWWTISDEIRQKRLQNEIAKERLRGQLDVDLSGLSYPDDFDNLGRERGRSSYIGVIHADGNSMGDALGRINQRHRQAQAPSRNEANQAYLLDMRAFSDGVKRAGQAALRAVVDAVVHWNTPQGSNQPLLKPNEDKEGNKYLSLRPIVYGGDDVTFVCEGRIALQAAQIFLQEFGKQKIPDVAQPIAAAGVAIVKAHYPFARAYQLAEALTSNAKKESERAYPALDWHLAQSGIFDQLGLMRERQYNDGTLLMRPLAISGGRDWRTWENFVGLVAGFYPPHGDPILPRNQVMDLRRALRQSSSTDPSPVRQITERLETRHLPLPALSIGPGVYQKDGWLGTRCVYYDAIEMKDQLLNQPVTEKGGKP